MIEVNNSDQLSLIEYTIVWCNNRHHKLLPLVRVLKIACHSARIVLHPHSHRECGGEVAQPKFPLLLCGDTLEM